MPVGRCVWLFLASGHFLIVACGACYSLPAWNNGHAMQMVRWYATVSGAGSSYGFFAPVVGAKHRVRFQLRDGNGSKWWDVFDEANNIEARLRLTGIAEEAFMSGRTDEFPEWRKQLAKSWAATMFTRHPSAQSVTLVVEYYDIPRIAEVRGGALPSWKTIYQAQIQRRAVAPRGEAHL